MPDKPNTDETDTDRLEHTAGGVTTRDDATDLGVPMLPGSGDEPQGPEDALGSAPTRGDYRGRLGDAGQHHESVRVPHAKPGEAQVRVNPQSAE